MHFLSQKNITVIQSHSPQTSMNGVITYVHKEEKVSGSSKSSEADVPFFLLSLSLMFVSFLHVLHF